MRRLTTLGLAALALTTAVTGSAVAAPSSGYLLSADDVVGDVVANPKYATLTPAQLQTVDIRSVTLRNRADRVHFDVALGGILTGTGVEAQQIVIIRMKPVDKKSTWSSQVQLTPQRPTAGNATYFPTLVDSPTQSTTYCSGLAVTTSADAVVTVKVPDRCLPTEPTTITVRTKIGTWRTSGTPVFSRDSLAVSGNATIVR